ncbi:MAG TPA: aldo/keto reductase [Acidobacteriaceae bacterium]|jgi:L-galactose dehydrogenase|nr:aldo/keto reductase [Acidobacteriaceae bacterium]
MEYRKLGRTELNVSTLGFGASPLGDVFGPVNPAAGERAVHLAIDHGINFFDVAPYYGPVLAEERLGKALLGRRTKVILASKCGRYGVDTFDYSPRRIRSSIEESLRRLHTDYLDLYQVHDVEFGSIEQIVGETLPTLWALQKEGKVRYVGITGYMLRMLMRVAEAASPDSILSYCRYNLLVDDLDRVLVPYAQERGIGVINASALHMGILSSHGAPEWHPAADEVRQAGIKASRYCREHGANLSQIALQFCFGYNKVATTLVGMRSMEEVRRNLRALATPLDPALLAKVRTILAPAFNMVWPSGLPANHDFRAASHRPSALRARRVSMRASSRRGGEER